MAELVLHIGTIKTGSSFLQRYLSTNVSTLERSGWNYPDFLGHENHRVLCLPFEEVVTIDHVQRSMVDSASRARSADRWAQQFSEHVKPGQRWIITAERFSSRLQSPTEVQAAVGFLRRFFDDITVVVFFRRQEFVLPSAYSQFVKASGSRDWSWEFCEMRLPAFDYDAMYQRWSEAVGPDNIRAVPYLESSKRDPGKLLTEFAAASGIVIGPGWVTPTESKANSSLSAEGIALMKAINPYVPRLNPDNSSNRTQRQKVIERVMDLTQGLSFRPGPEVVDRLTQYYLSSNEQLVSRLPTDQAWQEWLDQPAGGDGHAVEVPDISADRVAELMVALSEPAGPVAWGRAETRPVPLRRIVIERLADRRHARVLHSRRP